MGMCININCIKLTNEQLKKFYDNELFIDFFNEKINSWDDIIKEYSNVSKENDYLELDLNLSKQDLLLENDDFGEWLIGEYTTYEDIENNDCQWTLEEYRIDDNNVLLIYATYD